MKDIPVHITIKSMQKIYEPKNKAATARAFMGASEGDFSDISELEDEIALSIGECSKDYDELLPFSDNGNGESKIELTTEGVMHLHNNRIEISYEESELTGMEGSSTSLYFSPDKPKTVLMKRRGTVSSNMIFEENTRSNSMYNTGVMPFQIIISTKRIDNSITLESGGVMDIVYNMEINGNMMQVNRFNITVTRDDM